MKPADGGSDNPGQVIVGKISGIYGVSGWVRIISYTRPVTNILSYSPWLVGQGEQQRQMELLEGRMQGKGLVARLLGLEDRDVARSYIGKQIALYRQQMPDLPAGEYYWCDLMQLDVVTLDGVMLGKVTEILETGANDVLVVEGDRRHLVPLIMDRYVTEIDVSNGRITVDWNPEYS
jgi:16S rRNA processing protein RimM